MPPPPAPSFDYYAELEVSRSATLQEITSAYRRLARVHHPDKNPNDQDAATTRFQRVQQAYETLSSAAGRNRYDTFSTSRGTCTCGHCYDDDDEDGEYYSDYDDDDEYHYDFPFGHTGHRRFFSSGQRHGGFTFGGSRFRSYEDMEKFFQEQERKEAERVKILAEERRQREHAEAVRRKAKEDEKKAEEEASRKAEEARKAEERSKQEDRWKEVGAVTKDEKLKMCLHSDFCTKVPQKKKFKCGLCGKKGGMMAFECPYCSSFLCQQCLTKYQKKRDNDEYSIIPKAKPKLEFEPEEEVFDESEEGVEPEPDTEPVPEPKKVSRTNSTPSTVDFKQQQNPSVLNNNALKVPQKDVEDKYDAINGQALKKAKKHYQAADGSQIENGHVQESDFINSVPDIGIKVNGKLDHKTTSSSLPTTNGESELPQTQKPLLQTDGSSEYTTKNYVRSSVQKHKLPINRLYTKNGYNVTQPQLSKPAPRAHGIAGLQPFPPPAPEPLPAEEPLEKEAHVNQGFNMAVPTGPSRLRKQFAYGSKPQFGFSCYICGGQHLARNCSQPRSCYNCGKTGHLAKHCIKTNAANDLETANSLGGPDPRMAFPDFQTEPETQTVVTKAAIKGATLARGITGPLLRQAMECFGLVTECEIDRKAGIAWAVFVESEALRNAIAASPVAVAKGAVRISEWTGN